MTKAATKILIKGALLTIPPSLVMGAICVHSVQDSHRSKMFGMNTFQKLSRLHSVIGWPCDGFVTIVHITENSM